MSIYEVNNKPTIDKIENFDDERNTYYRFQNKDWGIGTQSWGMIYSTPEEAIEDGSTVLNGKSCCSTAKELYNFMDYFDTDFNVLILEGDWVEEGHDGEDVVEVSSIKEIWSFEDFKKIMWDMED
jgi:hypothetical protein